MANERYELEKYFRRRGLSREDAEDLAQVTLIKALIHEGQFRRESERGPWITSIARNALVDHVRMLNRRIKPVSYDAIDMDADCNVLLAEKPNKDMNNLLDPEMFAHLPERTRVMLAAYLEGATYERIGRVMGISAGGARNVIYRACKSIRKRTTI